MFTIHESGVSEASRASNGAGSPQGPLVGSRDRAPAGVQLAAPPEAFEF